MKSLCRFLFVFSVVALAASLQAAPKLGLQTWTCRHMSFEEAVVFAAEHGITQLELFNKHLDPAAPLEELLKKKEFMAEYGVTAYSIGVSGTSMDKEENRKLFELAKLFDMEVIVVEPREPAQWDVLEELVQIGRAHV